jgi:hypothetical protein
MRALLSEPDGACIYGIWALTVQTLSRQQSRQGWITQDGKREGRRLSASDLAHLWGRRLVEVYRMLQVCTRPDVDFIRLIDGEHQWPEWLREQDHDTLPPDCRQTAVALPPDCRPTAVALPSKSNDAEVTPDCRRTDVALPSWRQRLQAVETHSLNGDAALTSHCRPTALERRKERRDIPNKTVPTTTDLPSPFSEKTEVQSQKDEIKAQLNSLFQNNRPWTYEEDQLLDELMPISHADRELIAWAHKLPPTHPLHEMTKLRQKRVSLLRDLGGELDKIRAMRRQMGYGEVKTA